MLSSIFTLIAACLFNLTADDNVKIITIKQVRFFEDTTKSLSFEELIEDPESYLSFDSEFIPADYNATSAYWVELNFCINDANNHYILEFYDQSIDTISLYLRHEGQENYEFYQFGDQLVFSEREFNHKNFQVNLNSKGSYSAYFRVSNREYADIRIAIRDLGLFINYALLEYYFYGIFYGMIIIISLYNILIYSAIREVKYLYYTFYILSVGLFAMSVDGIAYQMLWPTWPNWNTVAHGFFLFSLIIWSVIFSKKFLRLRSRAPRLNKLLTGIIIARSLIFVYALIFDNRVLSFRNIEIITLLIIFVASIYVYRGGYKPARFFIVAYGVLFAGFIIKALLMYSILPFRLSDYSQTTQILSYYSLHLCFLLEMLFLSIALSDRVRILKENRDLAMRRIVAQQKENLEVVDGLNARLEERISKRTLELRSKNEELENANSMLSTQKTEIAAINSLLDLDNWKLRNNLKSAQTKRLLNKTISFVDFNEVLPDKESALNFMADVKWKKGYHCKRCENDKFIGHAINHARRCTRCGYNETPTTDTVFHAIKFPLTKAMYILYLWLIEDGRSLSELSIEMNLRRNTIWSMQKKIEKHKLQNPTAELNIFYDLEIMPESR